MKSTYVMIDDNIFEALITESFEEQSLGLMYQYPPTPIMCFKYAKPGLNKFWMKNTYAELDIVFCCNGIVNQVCHGKPMNLSLVGDDIDSDLVIELPYGTMKSVGAGIGSKVKLI